MIDDWASIQQACADIIAVDESFKLYRATVMGIRELKTDLTPHGLQEPFSKVCFQPRNRQLSASQFFLQLCHFQLGDIFLLHRSGRTLKLVYVRRIRDRNWAKTPSCTVIWGLNVKLRWKFGWRVFIRIPAAQKCMACPFTVPVR